MAPASADDDSGLAVGTSIGIAVGVIVGVGLLATIGYLAKKKKSAKNTVVKELSFLSQLPYAEEEGAPGAAPPSASAVGAVVPVVRPIVTTYDPTTNGGAATDSKV